MNKAAANQSPFIRVREVISSTPWGAWIKPRMPLKLREHFFMPFWPKTRLRRHLEMLQAFGFNSIQITVPTPALWVGADPAQWREHQIFMLQTAREMGMTTAQFVWGAATDNPAGDGQQVVELDWHKPADRRRLEAWYRTQAVCAPYIDRVVTHWIDPGYGPHCCQDCTIDTVVEMHNCILNIYREKNPQVRGALSTWFMEPGRRWPGYTGPGPLAAHPALDKDSDIVLGLMNCGADGVTPDFAGELKAGALEAIAAAGRNAGVWAWYTTDHEVGPALHVRIDVLQRYFRDLPSATRTQLAWHSLDDNFPGLNMHNLYVAGQLMQDPTLDAGKLLQDFVRGLVGEVNVPAVTAALRAVEQACTRSIVYRAKITDATLPTSVDRDIRGPLPASWLTATAQAVDTALAGLKHVRLAADFRTAWPVTMEPSEYLGELQAHLEAIQPMLAFLKGAREVERLQANGVPVEDIHRAIADLPKVVYDPAHTAGLEAEVYERELAALVTGVRK